MSNFWRTATATASISGSSLFQTAWTNSQGEIQSFDGSLGDRKVQKYFNPATLSVMYKLILPGVIGYTSNTILASDDGVTYTSYTANLDYFLTNIKKANNGRYFSYAYKAAWGDYYLAYSDDKTNWTNVHSSAKFIFDARGSTIVGIGSGSSPNTIRYSTNNGASFTTSATIGDGDEIFGIACFSNGKIGIFYYTDLSSTIQAKVRILNSVSDTTGTVYDIGSSFIGGYAYTMEQVICDGTKAAIVIHDENYSANVLYTVTSAGVVSQLSTIGYFGNSNYKLFISSQGHVFAFNNAEIFSNLTITNPAFGNYMSNIWEVGGKLWVFWDTGSGYQTYSSTDNGTSWTLESLPTGIAYEAEYSFIAS